MKTTQIMPNGKIKVTLRDIAILFSRAIPDQSYKDIEAKTEEILTQLKQLPIEAKVALKSAYIFAGKVPHAERADFYQDLALALLKAHTPDERLAYAIARCDWRDWWNKQFNRAKISMASLDEPIRSENEENAYSLSEILVGEMEFESKMCAKLDARRILDQIPKTIKRIGVKRMCGRALTGSERVQLCVWLKRNPIMLAASH